MLTAYVKVALERAHYEIIEDDEPFYGEIPELVGVWATGRTLEDCRHNLQETVEGWIILSLKRGLPIPEIDGHRIDVPDEMEVGG